MSCGIVLVRDPIINTHENMNAALKNYWHYLTTINSRGDDADPGAFEKFLPLSRRR